MRQAPEEKEMLRCFNLDQTMLRTYRLCGRQKTQIDPQDELVCRKIYPPAHQCSIQSSLQLYMYDINEK